LGRSSGGELWTGHGQPHRSGGRLRRYFYLHFAQYHVGLGQRLDRQEYILPAAIARQTLASVTITDTGNEGNGTNGSRRVLENLPDAVSVVNRSTPSTCFVPIGSPTLVALPKGSSLARILR